MAKVALTDRTVAAAKAESGKRLELWDERTPGLCLRVTDRGVKTWVYRYRTTDGRQPRFTLGRFPAVGLRDAREAAAETVRAVIKGADPATDRRKVRASATGAVRTFNDLADLYERQCASGDWRPKGKTKRARTLADEKGILRRHIRPAIGKLPYGQVGRADVKAFLRKMRTRGIGAQTNRAHAVTRQVFAFAIAEDLVAMNPATGFAPLAEETPRSSIWLDDQLQNVWAALTDPSELKTEDGEPVQVGESMRIAIKLAAMLGQRRNEVIGMEVSELNLSAKTWLIRAERMKGNRPHMVPLSDAAVDLINRAAELANEHREEPSQFVFPTSWTDDRAMKPDSMTRALRRMTDALGIAGLTLHDLRRTVSTNLTSERIGVSPFIRSKVLGHQDAGGGAMVSSVHYDANTYLAEKRRALTAWTDLLLEIVGERPRPSNVTGLRVA